MILRENIHSGRLNIEVSKGNAIPVEQHFEYHLVSEGCQRTCTCRENIEHTHLLRRRLIGMVGRRVRVGINRCSGKNNAKIAPDRVRVLVLFHCRRTFERLVKTPQTAHVV